SALCLRLLLLIFLKHSLTFYATTSSGLQTFPEFLVVSKIDDVQVSYCDSIRGTVEPRQVWIKKLMDNDPQYLKGQVQICLDAYQDSKAYTEEFKQYFNDTSGIVRFVDHCVVVVDCQSDCAAVSSIFHFKQTKHIYHLWKKKYEYLETRNLPSVSLLQKTASSPVTCHATGFYPDRADLFWTKDGEELHEDVDKGEILPNHDGSFQMSVDLNISSIAPEDWKRYHCVFQLSGVKDDIKTKLDKAAIRTNRGFPAGAVIGVVVVLLLLALCITGLFIWRKRYKGTQQHKNSCPAFTFKADIYKNISSKL
uniref:Ig-like domain-containing protein n=1 Tax=Stegastes partitus TaxID=144197 RepID=A0A3B4ZUT7_9TELE